MRRLHRGLIAAVLAVGVGGTSVRALEDVRFRVVGATDELRDSLRSASLLLDIEDQTDDVQEILSAARAEYGRLLAALYAAGHFGGVINIDIDGREASTIAPLQAPAAVRQVTVQVQPGPQYRFSAARIGPLARSTELPDDFAPGAPASTRTIRRAGNAAVDAWRSAGHAKADIAGQDIVARHEENRLSAEIAIAPGPLVRFGDITFEGSENVRERRLREIAGLPVGDVYSPAELERSASRLRRSGVFRSVSLTEAETVGPGDTLDITATLVEERPRRFGFGAEVNSIEGLALTAFWLHRNILGGAERFRVDGEIAGIGGSTGGEDYSVALSFTRPATFSSRNDLYVVAGVERLNEPDYTSTSASLGAGIIRVVSDEFTIDGGVLFRFSRDENDGVTTEYALLEFPVSAEYDRRNDELNPTDGYFVDLTVAPFAGLNSSTDSGARATLDARGYQGFGDEDRFVVAARLQYGGIFAADLVDVPNDFRFYSGGGGTVRGHDYQSLGVELPEIGESGGAGFVGASAELRTRIRENIQLVGFADWGYVSEEPLSAKGDGSHSGAGLGVRYLSPVGPIRLDVAVPVTGESDNDYALYVGIGQSF